MSQNEIIRPARLFDDTGKPQNFGWSRKPYHSYDPTIASAARNRISESDRYIVHSPTHLVVFEIRDDGWLGHVGISVIALRDKSRCTESFISLMPFGSFEMPRGSLTGNTRWRRKKTHLDFINMGGGVRIIKADIPKFGQNRSLRCALVLSEPSCESEHTGMLPQNSAGSHTEADSIVICQPWMNDNNAFRYARCSPWFITEGVIQFGGHEIIFTKGNAWGILDWNRYVRPKSDIRYWAAACGMSGGKPLSFCVGYSLADSSYGTENGFFVGGRLHKLEQVTFHIPLSNRLSPWRFTSNDNRLEMTFQPHQERIDRRNLFFHYSARHQLCGFFSGKVQLDDGTSLKFQNLTGFAERNKMQL